MDHLKTCSKCREAKPRGEFNRHKARKDGLANTCKPCDRARAAAWREANPEKHRARNAEWRKANPEKHRAKADAWRKANPDREAARLRVRDAKRTALSALRASRYVRAFGYFEGRPGWASVLLASLSREKRLHEMTFKNQALEEYLAEFA